MNKNLSNKQLLKPKKEKKRKWEHVSSGGARIRVEGGAKLV